MKKLLLFFVLVAATVLATAGIAGADHSPPDGPAVAPTTVSKEDANACAGGVKIENPSTGLHVFTIDGGSSTVHLQITVVDTAMGPTFTFESLSGEFITGIYVKGGPGDANFYNYGAGGIFHDDGLHSILNPNSGKWYGLSHICVFADKT